MTCSVKFRWTNRVGNWDRRQDDYLLLRRETFLLNIYGYCVLLYLNYILLCIFIHIFYVLMLIIIHIGGSLLYKYPNKVLRGATVKRRYRKKLIFNYRDVIDVVKLYKVLEPGSHQVI